MNIELKSVGAVCYLVPLLIVAFGLYRSWLLRRRY